MNIDIILSEFFNDLGHGVESIYYDNKSGITHRRQKSSVIVSA